uniref:Uncharacterized protein n=1 Tax=Romanomermis culicivorax TaxID=13658 RepID=A0A915KFS4_ROMCU
MVDGKEATELAFCISWNGEYRIHTSSGNELSIPSNAPKFFGCSVVTLTYHNFLSLNTSELQRKREIQMFQDKRRNAI